MLNSIKDTPKPMSLLSLILSFLALFVISGLLFAPIDKESKQVLIGLDFIICSVFLFQLTIDLFRSQNKKEYLKVHWIDFLASIPMIEPLRFARIFQILRVILVLRSSKRIFRELFRNRKETTFASIILLLVILLTIGAGTILLLEHKDPNANITTGHDALWWAFVTISTVGYGDHYPVTTAGQLIASIVIICGVGVFGMISGLITSLITEPTDLQNQQLENKERKLDKILEQQQQILERLELLERQTKK
ncbi:cAMP-dependent Kef-type K+ transport system [Vibrio chagasii]|jgi:voltage-gated potassium channel|uniref:potassium channel family protein n=1 Tax=Vibrio TaxID=662 RepID=UPI000CF42BD8|nr:MULTISPECIES: potassium channel family protein [Vibrio]MDE9382680.1 ion transporter [Vibrio alginolyticus]MCG9562788.1 potassium channel family protein [Vibrio chagasii]MCG9565127.1 potassium channel family protein [Vibrio chagasii]MCG9606699.1 potassium channel family protein [Vibrio chagasii]MCG9675004.1 potassium channel family protein [Vibrio chagasii]